MVLCGLLLLEGALAQNIAINSQGQALTDLLQQLNQEQGWPISYHTAAIKDCTIDLQQDFLSPQAALEAIVAQCDLQLRRVNGVFIIIKEEANLGEAHHSYLFKGIVVDASTKEPLPFATVRINNQDLIANENGAVWSNCSINTVMVEVAHLGYYNLRKSYLLEAGQTHYLLLTAAATQLEEITITTQDSTSISNGQQGTGISQLNAARLPFLAGNTTNSLFAYLRLQAGVQAAGEPEKDFVLWGSYKGQSHLLYDGITLFSPTSYNNVLGMINPAFVQAVELHKGGQQVDIGDRVGGVVHLHSPRGNLDKNSYEIGVSNQLVDVYANISLRKKGNLQIGLRHVLPHTFRGMLTGLEQQPFFFSDLHLKYSQYFSKGWSLKVSALGNYDFSEKTRILSDLTARPFDFVERRGQLFAGASMQLYKEWDKIGQTRWQFSSSAINFDYEPNLAYVGLSATSPFIFDNKYQKGSAEARFQMEHSLPATCWHQPSFGVELVHQETYLTHPWPINSIPTIQEQGTRVQGHIKDRLYLLPALIAEVGLKWTVPVWNSTRLFLQPRLNVTYTPHPRWKISWAMGNYQQFLTENSLIDRSYNHAYHWSIATSKETPILQSHHQVLSFSYVGNGFQANLNGYYKTLNNLSRYKVGAGSPNYGKARSYGVDAQLAYKRPIYNIWVAYNLGKTEESFCPSCNELSYRPALHDQRHELKVAGMLRWKYFSFSVNYVFGSGLPNPNGEADRQIYSRLDAALLFEYQWPSLKIEAGLSLLNVLNRYNRPYLSYQSNQLYTAQANLHQGPTLFLRSKF